MSTTKNTQQTSQFAPSGMQAYNQLTPAFSNLATGFMQNPYGNPQFQFEQQLGTRNAANQNQMNLSNLTRNATALGMAGGSSNPAFMEMLNNMMRGNTANTAMQGFINPTQMANQRQQTAMGMASQFRPLQTGQKQVESTHGLGTWLPQVANMGLGLATGGLFGGGLGQGFFSGANSPLGQQGYNAGMMNSPMAGVSAPDIGSYGGGGGGGWFGPQMGGGYGGSTGGMMPWMQPGIVPGQS